MSRQFERVMLSACGLGAGGAAGINGDLEAHEDYRLRFVNSEPIVAFSNTLSSVETS